MYVAKQILKSEHIINELSYRVTITIKIGGGSILGET